MFTKVSIKIQALLATLVGMSFIGCQDHLEVRTFDLERLAGIEAEALVTPYVYTSRENAPGMSSHVDGVLTVRELPENLDRIAEVLARHDRRPADVTFQFQLVEANGFTGTDESIAEVEDELRRLLKYDGYRVVGSAVLKLREGSGGHQTIDRSSQTLASDQPEPPFELNVEFVNVAGGDDGLSAQIAVQLSHDWYGNLLDTRVTVGDGASMVLGTASSAGGEAEALILVVTPGIETH